MSKPQNNLQKFCKNCAKKLKKFFCKNFATNCAKIFAKILQKYSKIFAMAYFAKHFARQAM